MKSGKYCLLIILTCIGFGFGTADAQENLAQQAYTIFQQNCLNCHGESGAYKDELLIDRAVLVNTRVIIPGDPENSEFYKRLLGSTENGAQMPLNLPPLSQEAVETIAHWITAGAPDWDVQYDLNFITTDAMLDTMRTHLESLDPFDRPSARYFTMTHLHNAGESPETLNDYRIALSKLVNSLSWRLDITNPTSIDTAQTIFYIDLRRYEWNTRIDVWTHIEQAYPYNIAFDPETQAGLLGKLTQLQTETGSTVPFVHVDWFLATASLPPLYHDILGLPQTDRLLETQLEIDVASNITNAPGINVWRAGVNNSGVSLNNRVVERHASRYGAYWKSYDFAGNLESQHIFTHPLDFTHDGGEIIFNLPNGLQAYFLVDANGSRLNDAPIDIVSNPAASDPTVRNGLSCIGCHTQGMKKFKDSVRAAVEQDQNPSYNKEQVLRLYPEQSVLDELLQKDTLKFQQALEKIGGPFVDDASRQQFFKRHENEPVQRFHEAFQAPLDASHAAAAVGLETAEFLTQISEKQSLKNLGLQTLIDVNGTVKRDAWTSNFDDMISALNTPDSILPPVVERPDRILGASVHIPDANLRAAIAEALGKAPNALITAEEMATLERLYANGMGISDLTGLEFATNLFVLYINDNLMPDLSPISELTQLGGLRIAGNKISDISPLKELKNLGALEIYANEISDISPLAGLTNLHWLSMYNNPVSDLSPLANLKNLRGMRVSVEEPGDLSPIAELTNLEDIYYWDPGDPVPNLSPLTNLPKLTRISIEGGKMDLSPLAGLTSVKELWLFNCGISNLSFLEKLTGLERLDLSRNNISDVSPLVGLTNLKWLKLTNNPISDFSPLEELAQTTNILTGEVAIRDPHLRAAIAEALGKGDAVFISITAEEMATLTSLRAQNKGISDLTGLEYAINLEDLYAPGNQISDLSPLSELINLRVLNIWNNPIGSLSPIAGLSNLERITLIGDGGITDLSPLAGLVKLRHFLSWGNPITDLSPLVGLTELETIDICGSEALDISTLANLKGVKRLYLASNGISDVSSLSRLNSLTHLNLEWNKISDVSPLAALRQLKYLGLHHNSISDFSPLAELSETTVISRAFNPGAPIGGPKIEGPWLWVTVPGEHLNSTTDLLAEASGDVVTEKQIATFGAIEGKPVGNSKWTASKISPTGENNIIDMLEALGIETDKGNNDRIIYGSITLDSPRAQHTNILFGSNTETKIWLNGELVHQKFIWNNVRAANYHHFFPVTLKQGENVLLVAVDHRPWTNWCGFFGFEEGTEYTTVIPPSVGFTFSTTETNLLADDTFTLNLNAENITDLAGWQADIAYDHNMLEAVEVTEGDFLKAEGGGTFFQDGTIDNTTGKITDLFSARISESGISGTGALLSVTFKAKAGGKTQVTLENFEFSSISGAVIPSVPPDITITVGEYPAWDVNQDGRVSVVDLVLVAKDLGSDVPANLRTDVNRDGAINIQDLILVAQHLGESTDAAAPSAIVIDSLEIDPAKVQAWITQAQVADDGSLTFQRGINNLERLLALFIPEETALFHNYPNPFNPETWIPYQLAKPAEVTLTIYATNGAIVRTLVLGHQPAGIYQYRSRAAYWDGKNELGEPVASGIYFYTLTAGDFNATRKMLIRK